MILKEKQINFYYENGYLVIDNLFSKHEIKVLNEEALKFNHLKELPNVILEKNGDVRSVVAPHKMSSKYNDLYTQNRIANPAKQLLGGEIYLYQFKLNNKESFVGNWWERHQDFPYWHTTIQGPLIFISKSYKNRIVDFEPMEHLMTVSNSTKASGAAGSCIFFIQICFMPPIQIFHHSREIQQS